MKDDKAPKNLSVVINIFVDGFDQLMAEYNQEYSMNSCKQPHLDKLSIWGLPFLTLFYHR